MIQFKDFLDKNLLEGFRPGDDDFEDGPLDAMKARELAGLSSMKDHKSGKVEVVATYHGAARAHQRFPDADPEHWEDFSSRIVKFLSGRKSPTKDQEYLVHSKVLGHSVVANLRYDPDKKQIRYMTVLPKGRSFARNNTQKLTVESHQNELEYIEID